MRIPEEVLESEAAKTALRNSNVLLLSAVGSKLQLPVVHVDNSPHPFDFVLYFGQEEHGLQEAG